MIFRLSKFFFADSRIRWSTYLTAFALSFVYGVVNTIVFERPEDAVSYEAVVLLVTIAVIGMFLQTSVQKESGFVRAQRRRDSATTRNRKDRRHSRPQHFPAFLRYAGSTAVVLLLVLANVNLKQVQAAVVRKALENTPVRSSGETVPRIVKAAETNGITVNPSVVFKSGVRLASAATTDPQAWRATEALLHYRSFINSKTVALPSNGFGEPTTTHYYGNNIGPNGRMSVVQALVPANPNETPQFRHIDAPDLNTAIPYAPPLIIIDDASFELDRMFLRKVLFQNSHIIYHGGPVVLEDVTFINCTVDVEQNPNGIAFTKAVLGAESVTFKTT